MPIGPGKYDELCTEIRQNIHAQAVILIIKDGDKGSGFSMQAPLEACFGLPAILRHMAEQIEDGLKDGKI